MSGRNTKPQLRICMLPLRELQEKRWRIENSKRLLYLVVVHISQTISTHKTKELVNLD